MKIHKQGLIPDKKYILPNYPCHVDLQYDIINAWYNVEKDYFSGPVEICVIGTGWELEGDDWVHVKTFLIDNLVWHVVCRDAENDTN